MQRHTRTCAGAGLVSALALALACASHEPAPNAFDQRLAEGRALYETYCIACHGADGSGGVVAPYLNPPPPDLRGITARHGGVYPHAKIEAWIDGRDPIASHGTREMPVWGKSFAEESELDQLQETRVRGQILLIVDYLGSIQQR